MVANVPRLTRIATPLRSVALPARSGLLPCVLQIEQSDQHFQCEVFVRLP
jgi:hypothetical protein